MDIELIHIRQFYKPNRKFKNIAKCFWICYHIKKRCIMELFARVAERILNISTIYLIDSPTYKLLKIFFIFFIVSAFLIALTFSTLVFIALPILLFVCYFYYLFSKIWRSYKFSTLYLILLPILALACGAELNILIF